MAENRAAILIVDDEEYICGLLSRLMEKEGFKPLTAHDGDSALKMIRSDLPEVMLLDLRMPGMQGMEVMGKAKELDPELPVVVITAHADIHGAVEAMKAGAHDYLAKPFEHNEVIRILRRALAERELKLKLKHLSSQIGDDVSLGKMMGPSDAVGLVISDVNRVAKSESTCHGQAGRETCGLRPD